ncbi:molybdenum cofactor guanylyltransferase [Oryzobacter terrae]|uniref:molybdenum cofactor guanylyltransferase n=1 Tax=Oryzobacter terrae TaxID=1620385 RepID=UPI0036717FD4
MTESGAGAADTTAVVLAGGTSRRFGSDKLAAPLRGSTVLDEALDGLPADWPVVVVGAERATRRTVVWTREDPPGGGPLAAVAAGLALVGTHLVAVLAGDMPDGGPAVAGLAAALRGAPPEVGAVVATDAHGVANPLLAAYRVAEVRRMLPDPARDRPAKTLFDVPHTLLLVEGTGASDVDTPADLAGLSSSSEPPDARTATT